MSLLGPHSAPRRYLPRALPPKPGTLQLFVSPRAARGAHDGRKEHDDEARRLHPQARAVLQAAAVRTAVVDAAAAAAAAVGRAQHAELLVRGDEEREGEDERGEGDEHVQVGCP